MPTSTRSSASGTSPAWSGRGNDPHHNLRLAREHPASDVLVAREDDDVIGSVVVVFDGHRGWLYYLAVDPGHQHRGAGRRLVRAAEDWLVAVGAPKVQLMVRSGNEAVVGFYRRLGYEPQDVAVLGKRLDQNKR